MKTVRHPVIFAIDGRPDLGLIVYDPATPQDAARILTILPPEAGGAEPAFFAR